MDVLNTIEMSNPYMYSVEDAIQKALSRKVPLKSGGSLIIEQTEAMTTIDVNTGTFVGKKTLRNNCVYAISAVSS